MQKSNSARDGEAHAFEVMVSPTMSQTTALLALIVAGLFEIGWAIGLKYTEGFARLWPTAWTATALVAGIIGLKLATPP